MANCVTACLYSYCCCPRRQSNAPPVSIPPQPPPPQSNAPSVSTFPTPPPPPPPPLHNAPAVSNSGPTPPNLQEVINNFQAVDIESTADIFIEDMKKYLNHAVEMHNQDAPSSSLQIWDDVIKSGDKILEIFSSQTENIDERFIEPGDQLTEIIGDMLKKIGHVHWAVAGLSIVGSVVSKCVDMSNNRTECLHLLQQMITLFSHIKELKKLIGEDNEKFEKVFKYIIEGCISCASQLHSGKLFRFLKSTVNSGRLKDISSKLSAIYADLNLMGTIKIIKQKTLITDLLPQGYPRDAVGIDDQLVKVYMMLEMVGGNMEDRSVIAVVIQGPEGIGKTTLAKAVNSKVDRKSYNFARIELDSNPNNNNHREMQQTILMDGFPNYNDRRKIYLRDSGDGRDHLMRAFNSASEPVFLCIDNVHRITDLERILPDSLRDLPQRMRMLVTTPNEGVKSVLEERGVRCKMYSVKPLSDITALEILRKDCDIPNGVEEGLDKIVKACKGIPLVLKTVRGILRKNKFNAGYCAEILGALQTSGDSTQEKPNHCNFKEKVNGKLETDTEKADLEIGNIFHDYYRTAVKIEGVNSLQRS